MHYLLRCKERNSYIDIRWKTGTLHTCYLSGALHLAQTMKDEREYKVRLRNVGDGKDNEAVVDEEIGAWEGNWLIQKRLSLQCIKLLYCSLRASSYLCNNLINIPVLLSQSHHKIFPSWQSVASQLFSCSNLSNKVNRKREWDGAVGMKMVERK